MEEEWANVSEWSDYLVSNLGRIYSVRSDIFLKHTRTSNGYYTVDLWKNGLKIRRYVHCLVAETFCDGYFEGAEVNHKNGIKSNLAAWNLEWRTHEDNIRHAYRTGLISRRPVRIIETGLVFESAADCAVYIGGYDSHVSTCLNGKRRTHKGFTFEYAD